MQNEEKADFVGSPLIQRSMHIARLAHQNQSYNGESYFSGHLLPVKERFQELSEKYKLSDKQKLVGICCAILHDTIEDTIINSHVLQQMLVTDLSSFSGYETTFEIARIVETLSHPPNLPYLDYIEDLIQFSDGWNCPVALLVKLADISVNMENLSGHPKAQLPSTGGHWMKKKGDQYLQAKELIEESLKSFL